MSGRLFIGNLPYGASEAELREHLSAVGELLSVVLPVDRETGRPRGFAFVEFADTAMAGEAIRRLNGQPFKGRTLSVSEARAREDRGPSDRPYGPPGPRPPRPADGPPPPRDRSFGPPAPPRTQRATSARRHKVERGPRGPIPIRGGGRVFDVEEQEHGEAPADFDDPATRAPDGEESEEER